MTTWTCLFAIAAMISSCLCFAAVAMNTDGDDGCHPSTGTAR
jgi:hypothetical protein